MRRESRSFAARTDATCLVPDKFPQRGTESSMPRIPRKAKCGTAERQGRREDVRWKIYGKFCDDPIVKLLRVRRDFLCTIANILDNWDDEETISCGTHAEILYIILGWERKRRMCIFLNSIVREKVYMKNSKIWNDINGIERINLHLSSLHISK